MGYVDVSAQALTFAMAIGLGAVLCLVYDLVRALHKKMVKGFFEVLVTDILFWVFAAFATFCFLIIRCQGSVRFFVLVGMLIGFFVVRFTVGKYVTSFFVSVFSLLAKGFRLFTRLVRKILAPVCKFSKFLRNIFKKVLQDKAVLLYNHFKVSDKKTKDVYKEI